MIKFKYLFLVFFSLSSILVQAQSGQLEFGAKVIYIPAHSDIYIYEDQRYNRTPINDSIFIQSFGINNSSNNSVFTSKVSAGFSLMSVYPISKKFSLRYGIEGQYLEYNRSNELIESSFTEIRSDTVSLTTSSSLTVSSCTSYTNSSLDFAIGFSDEIFDKIVFLSVPVILEYELLPNIVDIGLGGNLRTHLYSQIGANIVTIEREFIDDEIICTYVVDEHRRTTGAGLNKLQLDIRAAISFHLLPSALVRFEVLKPMSNFYHKVDQYGRMINYEHKPLMISLGLAYRLGEAKNKD